MASGTIGFYFRYRSTELCNIEKVSKLYVFGDCKSNVPVDNSCLSYSEKNNKKQKKTKKKKTKKKKRLRYLSL